jgi:hypothetical protein
MAGGLSGVRDRLVVYEQNKPVDSFYLNDGAGLR